jgi:hypothetical protein
MPHYSAVSTWPDRSFLFEAEDKDHARRLLKEDLLRRGEYYYSKGWRILALDDPIEVAMEEARQRHRVDFDISQATEIRIREATRAAVNQGFLVYDPADSPDLVFIEDLQKELSSYLPVGDARRQEHRDSTQLLSGPLISFLEIALITASTTVATGFLSKIGEDIWDKLKAKAQAAAKRDKLDEKKLGQEKTRLQYDVDQHAMGVTIAIKAGTTLVEGTADVGDYEGLIAALAAAGEMTQDAENRLTSGLDDIRSSRLYQEVIGITKRTSLFEFGLWFEYSYSSRYPTWRLDRVTNYRPDEARS